MHTKSRNFQPKIFYLFEQRDSARLYKINMQAISVNYLHVAFQHNEIKTDVISAFFRL